MIDGVPLPDAVLCEEGFHGRAAFVGPLDLKEVPGTGFRSQDAALRKTTYEESVGWYAGISADIFG